MQVEYTSPARPHWGGLLNLKPGTVSELELQVSLTSRFGLKGVVVHVLSKACCAECHGYRWQHKRPAAAAWHVGTSLVGHAGANCQLAALALRPSVQYLFSGSVRIVGSSLTHLQPALAVPRSCVTIGVCHLAQALGQLLGRLVCYVLHTHDTGVSGTSVQRISAVRATLFDLSRGSRHARHTFLE